MKNGSGSGGSSGCRGRGHSGGRGDPDYGCGFSSGCGGSVSRHCVTLRGGV